MAYQTNLGLSRFKWIVVCITALLALCSSTTKANYEQQLRTDSNAMLPISDDETTQLTMQDGDNSEERAPNFAELNEKFIEGVNQSSENKKKLSSDLRKKLTKLIELASYDPLTGRNLDPDEILFETLKQIRPNHVQKILKTKYISDPVFMRASLANYWGFNEKLDPSDFVEWLHRYVIISKDNPEPWKLWEAYAAGHSMTNPTDTLFDLLSSKYKTKREMINVAKSMEVAGWGVGARRAYRLSEDMPN